MMWFAKALFKGLFEFSERLSEKHSTINHNLGYAKTDTSSALDKSLSSLFFRSSPWDKAHQIKGNSIRTFANNDNEQLYLKQRLF